MLFLDEPTAGMDPQARRSLIGIIDNLRSSGVAVLLTTHVLADIEELADHVIVLRHGVIERSGTLAELRGEASSLSFDARSGLDLVDLMLVLPDGYAVDEVASGTYVVDGEPTPSVLAAITGWLAEHNEVTAGIRVGKLSLEDLIIGDQT
jgi:ABC-2 type transport system ATP-binding protein